MLFSLVLTVVLCGCGDTSTKRNYETMTFGSYNGQPLNWLVISENSESATLLCDTFVDKRDYNDVSDSYIWESCELRRWLNSDFYNSAFTSEEQERILSKTYSNLDNPVYMIDGGNDTTDLVTIPSLSDMEDIYYESVGNNTKGRDNHKEFCLADACSQLNDVDDREWWWLRSPGHMTGTAAVVEGTTVVTYSGKMVDDSLTGGYIRPMIELSLNTTDNSVLQSESEDATVSTDVVNTDENSAEENSIEVNTPAVYSSANFNDFWIDDMTYDVFGYLEANGAVDFDTISTTEKTLYCACRFGNSKFTINFYDTGYGCQVRYDTYLDSIGEGKSVETTVFGEQGKYDLYNVYGYANTYMTFDSLNVLQLLVEASRDNNIQSCPLCGATATHDVTKEYYSIEHGFWGLDR